MITPPNSTAAASVPAPSAPSPGTLPPAELVRRLLAWYDGAARVLPWRAPPGQPRPPAYRVWLSEIMLQQTTVATVIPYFQRFVDRWPTVEALAAAELDQVLVAWAGLGYYARARNLHRCARTVAQDYGGRFPETEAELLALPGIGAYTAAAVAAIAFDRPATVVDGNVERVIARLHAVGEPLPGVKSRLRTLAAVLTPSVRPGDYAQATMDLGATVCSPRQPDCSACPWAAACRARALGIAETLPRRAAKVERPTRYGVAFWLTNPEGAVLLRRRAERGLLGGMIELPSSPWLEGRQPSAAEIAAAAPLPAAWQALPAVIHHTFTHFHLELTLRRGQAGADWRAAEGLWVAPSQLGQQALPTVIRKLVKAAQG